MVFKAEAGDYVATYANDATPPEISGVNATADAEGHATVTWDTDEPASSRVEYGRTTALGSQVTDTARVTEHTRRVPGLSPNTTYHFRVSSTDVAGNSATSPPGASPPGASRRRPARWWTAGPRSSPLGPSGTYSGQSLVPALTESSAAARGGRGVRGHGPARRLADALLGRRRRGDGHRRRAHTRTARPPTRRRSSIRPACSSSPPRSGR